MIQSIRILNLQSHKNSLLEFHKGVNVIIGQSDSGKTAIIRALRWLIWNKPGGDSFRSDWGGDTWVTLTTDDAQIVRIKSKDNMYALSTDNTGEFSTEYRAFGAGVPEPIQQILNINEVNLQMQLDSHFMLSKSPGEVAAFFNKIAHLDQIDTALKSIASDIRLLTASQQSDLSRSEDLSQTLTEFDYLDKAEVDLEVLETLEKKWETSIKTKTL